MLTDEISRLLSDQFHTLQTLLQHSQTQCEMIREGRMTELLDVLSRKTPLIQSLQGTAAKLNSVDFDRVDWQAPTQRWAAQAIQQQCQEMSDSLMQIESECESLLVASRQAMSDRIAEFDQASAARESYANAGTQGPTVSTSAQSGGKHLDLSSG
jgi:RecB family endonuclease NucS